MRSSLYEICSKWLEWEPVLSGVFYYGTSQIYVAYNEFQIPVFRGFRRGLGILLASWGMKIWKATMVPSSF